MRTVDEFDEVGRFPLTLVLSLLCFAACLGARFLVPALPEAWRPFPRVVMPAVVATAFATVGTLLGLIARRSGTTTARLAFALNAVALLFSLLLIAALFYIYPGLLAPSFAPRLVR
jgi:hypothetical protein